MRFARGACSSIGPIPFNTAELIPIPNDGMEMEMEMEAVPIPNDEMFVGQVHIDKRWFDEGQLGFLDPKHVLLIPPWEPIPPWWLSLRDFLTAAEIQRILSTCWAMRWGGVCYFEDKVTDIHHQKVKGYLYEIMERRPPELLMQHLGAGGREGAMWMMLWEYLGHKSLPACFLTRRGDADVFFEVREYRRDLAQREMREDLKYSLG